jgi:two-component system response regulator RegA
MVEKAVILVVEDDAASAEMLTEMFSMADYAVETASTLDEVLAKLGNGYYHAALLDLTLPGVTTSELITQLQQLQERPPFIIFSARMPEDLRTAAEQLGAAAVLQKPAKMDVLLATLARVAGARG